jgi:hypothetical protein
MNKRIQELMEQAMELKDPYALEGEFGPRELNAEKFAELIVKECAQVAFEGDLKRAIGQWGSHSDILIHFGVEHDVVKKFRG